MEDLLQQRLISFVLTENSFHHLCSSRSVQLSFTVSLKDMYQFSTPTTIITVTRIFSFYQLFYFFTYSLSGIYDFKHNFEYRMENRWVVLKNGHHWARRPRCSHRHLTPRLKPLLPRTVRDTCCSLMATWMGTTFCLIFTRFAFEIRHSNGKFQLIVVVDFSQLPIEVSRPVS